MNSGRIFRRKFHIVGELPRERDAGDDGFETRVASDPELAREVQIRGREENVQPSPLAGLQGAGSLLDILPAAPRQRGDDGPAHVARYLPDRFGIGGRRDGEAGLDDVDPERIERPGERELRLDIQGEAGRLLAVTERGVEDNDARGIVTHTLVVTVRGVRSQSDNYYDNIS